MTQQRKKIQITDVLAKKQAQQPIAMLTAYDYTMAKLLNDTDLDMVLVGDSLGNIIAGYDTTLPVTMDQMVYHTQAVTRALDYALVVADMPFLSFEITPELAKENAGRLIKEGGAQAVKVEVGPDQVDTVRQIVGMGIPVMGHIGFTPQKLHQLGGYKVQGRSQASSDLMLSLAQDLEKAGCFSVLLELVPTEVAEHISKAISIPTIGIGAGKSCDGQILVTHDILGFSDKKKLKFVKEYAAVGQTIKSAVQSYQQDVITRKFPDQDHEFH